jgi:hypothetical protein
MESARSAQSPQPCAQCGAASGPAGAATRKCGACRGAWYCGTACQRAAWPAHKGACRQASAGSAGVNGHWGTDALLEHMLGGGFPPMVCVSPEAFYDEPRSGASGECQAEDVFVGPGIAQSRAVVAAPLPPVEPSRGSREQSSEHGSRSSSTSASKPDGRPPAASLLSRAWR